MNNRTYNLLVIYDNTEKRCRNTMILSYHNLETALEHQTALRLAGIDTVLGKAQIFDDVPTKDIVENIIYNSNLNND